MQSCDTCRHATQLPAPGRVDADLELSVQFQTRADAREDEMRAAGDTRGEGEVTQVRDCGPCHAAYTHCKHGQWQAKLATSPASGA